MSADARVTIVVSGHVQGVGFRYWTQRRANELGLRGSAVNQDDGRVRIVAEGPTAACEALVDQLRGSDPPGRVRDVAVRWGSPAGEPPGFRAG